MSSVEAVEEEFQKAVDRALCRVSDEPFQKLKAGGRDEAVRRITSAMEQLRELRGSKQPEYRDPDLALFYTQWHLPPQINVTYSKSVNILSQSPLSSTDELQLVDFGAGTGAMIIGLSLAIATRCPEQRPELIAVYQIDHRAMLELGDAIWSGIRDEAERQPILEGVAEVMDRTLFECVPLDEERSYDRFPDLQNAQRWLTAIHVAYDGQMDQIDADMRSLHDRLDPHVQIRTTTSSKKDLLASCLGEREEPYPIDLCMDGTAPRISKLRRSLLKKVQLHPQSQMSESYWWLKYHLDFLDGDVSWAHSGNDNAPYSSCSPEVERHA